MLCVHLSTLAAQSWSGTHMPLCEPHMEAVNQHMTMPAPQTEQRKKQIQHYTFCYKKSCGMLSSDLMPVIFLGFLKMGCTHCKHT